MCVEGCDTVLNRHPNIGTTGIDLGELPDQPFLQDARQESLPTGQLYLLTGRTEQCPH
jgi:hypothetical protein